MKEKVKTTKLLHIPAGEFLKLVAEDPDTVYPVTVSMAARCSWSMMVRNKEELLSIAGTLYSGEGVRSVTKRPGCFIVDLLANVYMTFPVDAYPEVPDKGILSGELLKEAYLPVLHAENRRSILRVKPAE